MLLLVNWNGLVELEMVLRLVGNWFDILFQLRKKAFEVECLILSYLVHL